MQTQPPYPGPGQVNVAYTAAPPGQPPVAVAPGQPVIVAGAGPPAQWMPMPTSVIPGCPPGLEYLTQLDQVVCHQVVEMFEVLTGVHMNNRFKIKNSLGQQCYYAYEDTDCCMRYLCGSNRGFNFHITDNAGNDVFQCRREFKLCAGCCWFAGADCCAWEVDVEAGRGNIIGSIRQMQSFWKAQLDIKDANGVKVLEIRQKQCCVIPGPCCTCDYNFEVYDMKGNAIGAVTRKFAGCMKECFTNATNFAITFPIDLDVKMKATLLAATFLIDMMFFEQDENNDN